MIEEPEVIIHPPAPEISDAEYPVPQEVLDWEIVMPDTSA